MQTALIKAGYSVGKAGADGYFGGNTLKAVNLYKNNKNLQNDTDFTRGKVGDTTWKALGLTIERDHAIYTGSSSSSSSSKSTSSSSTPITTSAKPTAAQVTTGSVITNFKNLPKNTQLKPTNDNKTYIKSSTEENSIIINAQSDAKARLDEKMNTYFSVYYLANKDYIMFHMGKSMKNNMN